MEYNPLQVYALRIYIYIAQRKNTITVTIPIHNLKGVPNFLDKKEPIYAVSFSWLHCITQMLIV
ncbi:MAG: hypothetical protein DRH08_03790 [Deltaproteobacteria bacterium]|nr:MAG: hypothetical protein DRH08_03790 [Deltaproteobacteria bacterium]